MNFELGKAPLSLCFYTDNPYFITGSSIIVVCSNIPPIVKFIGGNEAKCISIGWNGQSPLLYLADGVSIKL